MTQLIGTYDHAAVTEETEILKARQDRQEGLNVALVYGGLSAEDRLYTAESPTKQLSVTALSESLTEIGARFKILDPCDAGFIRELATFDVALSNLHGPYGEDGRLQGLLDYLRTPFCGSGVAASAIAADKILCKQRRAPPSRRRTAARRGPSPRTSQGAASPPSEGRQADGALTGGRLRIALHAAADGQLRCSLADLDPRVRA